MLGFVQRIKDLYNQLDGTSKVVIGLFGLAVLVTIAIYLVQKVRNFYLGNQEESLSDWASIEQMKDDGTLREYEYQHLRRQVAPKYAEQDNGDDGVEQKDLQNNEARPD